MTNVEQSDEYRSFEVTLLIQAKDRASAKAILDLITTQHDEVVVLGRLKEIE